MNPISLFFSSFYEQDFLRVFWTTERKTVWHKPTQDLRPQLQKSLERMYKSPVVLVQSGRAALRLGVRALNVQGQPIAVPTYICASVIRALIAEGCTPIFIDIDETFQIDLASLKIAIDKHKVRAVLAPHFGGIATNILAVRAMCTRSKIALIEDAAQSFGLVIGGKPAGSFGDVAILSFGAGKQLCSYDGGALVMRKAKITVQVLEAKEPSLGKRVLYSWRHVHRKTMLPFLLITDKLGLTERRLRTIDDDELLELRAMSATDAAVLVAQHAKLAHMMRNQAANAAIYRSNLPRGITQPSASHNTFLKYLVAFETTQQRDAARDFLRKHRIETEGAYTPMHERAEYAKFPRASVATTVQLCPRLLTLPTHAQLTTNDIRRICAVLKEAA